MSDQSQLELAFTGKKVERPLTRKQRKMVRAKWWFNHMRSVVSVALEWTPKTQPRPVQMSLAGANH